MLARKHIVNDTVFFKYIIVRQMKLKYCRLAKIMTSTYDGEME